jgi:hypothetical protein
MSPVIKFNSFYFLLASLIFCVEIFIAKYAHDQIIRPYVGDFLIVILIYCFIKSFFDTPVLATTLSVLIFSYLIETLQYFHLITWLGLQHSRIAGIVLGTSFAWIDLLAYTIGIGVVLFCEKVIVKRIHKHSFRTVNKEEESKQ